MKKTAVWLMLVLFNSFNMTLPLYAGTGHGLTADSSLNTLVDKADRTHNISGGSAVGNNLFHSFSEFNVESGETANFIGNQALANIISRVTGGNNSWINGMLKTTDTRANLYLLNTNGVMFGANVSLNIQGSFHVTTADYLKFENGNKLYASLNGESVLNVEPVEAFGFLGDDVGAIGLDGTTLTVSGGKSLSLIGGGESIINSALKAPGGRVSLASVESSGEVKLTENDIDTTSEQLGDIQLDQSKIDVNNTDISNSAGKVSTVSDDFEMTDESEIFADNYSVQDTADVGINIEASNIEIQGGSVISSSAKNKGDGGYILLSAAETVLFAGEKSGGKNKSGISSLIQATAEYKGDDSGKSGYVEIRAGNIEFHDGAWINSAARGKSAGGTVLLTAKEQVLFIGENSGGNGSKIQVTTTNAGKGGSVKIQAKNIEFTAGAYINSTTRGPGEGGRIMLNAFDRVLFTGKKSDGEGSLIQATTEHEDEGAGSSGYIEIQAKNIEFSDGAGIDTATYGWGNAGKVLLQANASIILNKKRHLSAKNNLADDKAPTIASGVGDDSTGGQGGYIEINAPKVILTNGANISAGTDYAGALTSDGNEGHGGTIAIIADSFVLEKGSEITGATSGAGAGGNVLIGDTALIQANNANGDFDRFLDLVNAGGVTGTRKLLLEEDSAISAGSSYTEADAGSAGNIQIRTARSIDLKHNSKITTQSKNAGGGSIDIQTKNRLWLLNSWIETSTESADPSEAGGNITIDPIFVILQNLNPYTVGIDNSRIQANANFGAGGNINIVADYLIQAPDTFIKASSDRSVDGEINIQSLDFDVSGSLVSLNTNLLDAAKWSKTPCALRSGVSAGKLILKGRDAVPTAYDDFLSGLPALFSDSEFFAEDYNSYRRGYIKSEVFEEKEEREKKECDD